MKENIKSPVKKGYLSNISPLMLSKDEWETEENKKWAY